MFAYNDVPFSNQHRSNRFIPQSSAIMRYLCLNNEGGEELYPSDPVLRAKIDMVMDWRQTSVYPCLPDIAYVIFGMSCSDEGAKKGFAKLIDEHFKILTDVYLKDTQFCYSDKPTIADLAVAPALTFIKVSHELSFSSSLRVPLFLLICTASLQMHILTPSSSSGTCQVLGEGP